MKKILSIAIITFCFITSGFCQTDDELIKAWNAEVERVGFNMANKIKLQLDTAKLITKELRSESYENGALKIYKIGESVIGMIKTYSKEKTIFTETYYFSAGWPVYVEIKNSNNMYDDKYYFDKTNLMLWVTSNNEYFNVSDPNYGKRWQELLNAIDKLTKISIMNKNSINEDKIN